MISFLVDKWIRECWDYYFIDWSDYECLCILPLVVLFGIFWMFNIVLTVFNSFPSLSPIEKYKIQPLRREKGYKVVWMFLNVCFNQALTTLITLNSFDNFKKIGMQRSSDSIPSISLLILQIVFCMFGYDVLFYIVHRFMHIPFMYKHVHKVHHSSVVSIGLTQSYFHPVEYLLTGLAVLLPPLLVSKHIITVCVWNAVLMIESLNAHTGYNLPFLPDTRVHDFHHSRPDKPSNFGGFFCVLDNLLGTDKNYKEHLKKLQKNE